MADIKKAVASKNKTMALAIDTPLYDCSLEFNSIKIKRLKEELKYREAYQRARSSAGIAKAEQEYTSYLIQSIPG